MRQIAAIEAGRKLCDATSLEVLLVATMNSIAKSSNRIGDEDATKATVVLGALFSLVTESD